MNFSSRKHSNQILPNLKVIFPIPIFLFFVKFKFLFVFLSISYLFSSCFLLLLDYSKLMHSLIVLWRDLHLKSKRSQIVRLLPHHPLYSSKNLFLIPYVFLLKNLLLEMLQKALSVLNIFHVLKIFHQTFWSFDLVYKIFSSVN